MDARKKCVPSAGKTMSIKFLVLGVFWVFGGGGGVPILFLWARGFFWYPNVSDFAGRNSDHGASKTRTKTQTRPDSVSTRERRNSDHGLSFWEGKTQTMVWISVSQGVGVDPVLMINWNRDLQKSRDLPHLGHRAIALLLATATPAGQENGRKRSGQQRGQKRKKDAWKQVRHCYLFSQSLPLQASLEWTSQASLFEVFGPCTLIS